MPAWDASQYLRFSDQRTQPAIDLLARINLPAPRRVIDLGCGPGNSTVLLQRRWPQAAITGLDSSEEMLETARRDHPAIGFVAGDIGQWDMAGRPADRFDLVYSNAALQWLEHHERLMPRLLEGVAEGGLFAVQMPRQHDGPTHVLMREIAAQEPWRERLVGTRGLAPVHPPGFYYDLLAPRCHAFDIWETSYIQPMDNVEAIIGWMRGTGMRPYLNRLEAHEQKEFLARYAKALAGAYPPRADGKLLLSYLRLFFIAMPGR
jgi:trans-aconitate 2-methyltransferase